MNKNTINKLSTAGVIFAISTLVSLSGVFGVNAQNGSNCGYGYGYANGCNAPKFNIPRNDTNVSVDGNNGSTQSSNTSNTSNTSTSTNTKEKQKTENKTTTKTTVTTEIKNSDIEDDINYLVKYALINGTTTGTQKPQTKREKILAAKAEIIKKAKASQSIKVASATSGIKKYRKNLPQTGAVKH